MGIFKAFQKAQQTIDAAKIEVHRPKKDEVAEQRAKKAGGQQKGGGKR
jgi:hypothetical protein